MAASTATEPPTQRKFGLIIWASIIFSYSVPWPAALARISRASQVWDRTTKHSTLHISVTYSSQRDMVSNHGGSALRGQQSIAIFADLCTPVSSYVSQSGMELWPPYNSSISTSQRISLELTEFCTCWSISEGCELCEDSCHRKRELLNIKRTAHFQHVPTSIPTPFTSDTIQTAFIDSLYSELKSIRTPLQNIPYKRNKHPAQIGYSQPARKWSTSRNFSEVWHWPSCDNGNRRSFLVCFGTLASRGTWMVAIRNMRWIEGAFFAFRNGGSRFQWYIETSVLCAKAKNAHVATNHSNVYQI